MRKLLTALLVSAFPIFAGAASGPLTLVDEAGLAYSTQSVVNLNAYGNPQASAGKISTQVTYGSMTTTNATFTDGTLSTGSITVASVDILPAKAVNKITVPATSAILGTAATNQFTVIVTTGLGNGASGVLSILTTTGITGTIVMINGLTSVSVVNGIHWATASTSSGTASNLATAINNMSALTGVAAAWDGGTSTIVRATATAMGLGTNLYTITSTTPTCVSSAAFSGAVAAAYLTVNGNRLYNGVDWTAQTTASATAASIATAVSRMGGIDAARGSGTSAVVYATATERGVAGNAFTLGSSLLTSISTASTNFTGGLDRALYNQWIEFNGDRQRNGYKWTDVDNTSTGTAASIAKWLDTFSVIDATATSNVVYATATVAGVAGNLYTLKASTTNLAITGDYFTGGQDAGYVTINGKTYTAGVDFSTGTTTQTATSLAAAITATSSTYHVIAAGQAAVVRATSTVVGIGANYALVSSTPAALVLSGANLTGGTTSGITISSSLIYLPSHGFTTGLAVLYSTSTNPTIGGLVNGTTYYVVRVDANNIRLSSTSVVAQTGVGITITSSGTPTTARTYTLAPLAWSQGTASAKWQVSNDCVNWADYSTTASNVSVSSQTFTAVLGKTTAVQDFGMIDYKCLRYNILAPSTGGVYLKVILNAKD